MRAESEVYLIVAKAIAEAFRYPLEQISAQTTAADVDGWDSVSSSRLFFKIEDALDSELPIEKLLASKDVGELAAAITAAINL